MWNAATDGDLPAKAADDDVIQVTDSENNSGFYTDSYDIIDGSRMFFAR